jgi:hypothetical protein
MLKENNKTFKQIDNYIRKHTPTVFSRGCGKSGMVLNMIQINYGLELYKDVVRDATEYMSFEQVLKNVVDAIYQVYKESEEDEE